MNPRAPAPAAAELRTAIWQLRPLFLRAFLMTFIASMLAFAGTVYMFQVYGRVVDSRNLNTLLVLTILVLGMYLVMELLEWVRSQIMLQAEQQFDDQLSERIFAAIFQATMLRGQGPVQQALGDLRTLREFFSSASLRSMMEFPVAIVSLAILFLIHPFLGWFAIGGGVVQATIAFMMERRTQPPLAAANKASNAAQTYAGNSLRNAQVIESMGMLKGIQQRWMKNQQQFLFQQAIASDQAGGLTAAAKAVQLMMASAVLGLACWLILTGDILDGGLMIVASILAGKAMGPIVQLISSWKQVVGARGAYGRLDELLQQTSTRQEKMSLPPPKGKLSVEALTAGAPGSPVPILRNISFALPAGECLVVVGPSASGKTTLARLLMGLWPAMAGKVRLDGADVFAWDKRELGPHVGYLPQGIELFDGTLAENIARFGEIDRTAVEAAAHLAGLDALLAELPDGLDSRIGDEGAFLSGGQRQRVGLARAVYGTPRFLVLDEPNSSLDEIGETALLALLRELKSRGVTIVLITHRTSVLAVADKMLLLVNGAAQAFGPRDEVLAALAKAQQAQQAQTVASQAPRPPALSAHPVPAGG